MKKFLTFELILGFCLALALSGCGSSGGGAVANVTDGLVAYYTFNGNANDSSGYGYNGVVNGATLVPDRFGESNHAYSFDGVNDVITVSHQQFISDPTKISVAMWVKPLTDVFSEGGYFIDGNDFGIWQLAGHLEFVINNNNGTNNADATVTLDTWNHFVGTFDGNDIKIFINGVLAATTNWPGTISNMGSDLTLGLKPPGLYYWSGSIDDFRIYDRVLSASEVSQLYNFHN